MGARRIAAIALSGTVILGGTGVAIAAVARDDGKKSEQAVLDNAAKRLHVTPEKLRDALSAAQDAQLDQAVKAGKLTQKQADAIKAARKRSGRVLEGPLAGPRGRGPGWHGPGGGRGFDMHGATGPGMHAFGPRAGIFADLATALGTTEAKLFAKLRSGTSLADAIKASGKSADDVNAAVKAATKTRLDKAVTSGDLTQKQADAMLEHVDGALKAIESGKPFMHRQRGGFGGRPPAGALRPGGFAPGQDAPPPVPGGTYS